MVSSKVAEFLVPSTTGVPIFTPLSSLLKVPDQNLVYYLLRFVYQQIRCRFLILCIGVHQFLAIAYKRYNLIMQLF